MTSLSEPQFPRLQGGNKHSTCLSSLSEALTNGSGAVDNKGCPVPLPSPTCWSRDAADSPPRCPVLPAAQQVHSSSLSGGPSSGLRKPFVKPDLLVHREAFRGCARTPIAPSPSNPRPEALIGQPPLTQPVQEQGTRDPLGELARLLGTVQDFQHMSVGLFAAHEHGVLIWLTVFKDQISATGWKQNPGLNCILTLLKKGQGRRNLSFHRNT